MTSGKRSLISSNIAGLLALVLLAHGQSSQSVPSGPAAGDETSRPDAPVFVGFYPLEAAG